jgi:adhesin/invasin
MIVTAAPATKLVAAAPSSVLVNGPFSLSVDAEDSFGNIVSTFNGSVNLALGNNPGSATLGGTLTVQAVNGVATFSGLMIDELGNGYTLQATATGLTKGTTAAIDVVNGSTADPATSTVSVSSSTLKSGNSITVTLQAKDSEGNDIASGGLTVGFALGSTSGGQGTFSSVTDNGNGTYTATFTGTIAGSNTITATMGGAAVTTSPPAIAVTPGPFSLAKSIVTVSPGGVQSGGTSRIALQAKDAAGNDETSGGLTVAFKLGSTSGGQGTFSSVTDNGNGTYTATFTGTIAGNNTIEATIDGSTVTSTTPTITVAGGAFSLAKSIVTVSPGGVQSGGTTTITLQAEDAKGNKETRGGLTVAFKLKSTSGGQGTFSSVTDNGNGTYTATFTGTLAGSNTITATIDGSVVTSTAPSIKVTPGPFSLANSVVTLSRGSVQSGSKSTITLQAKDAAGNKETSGGLKVLFSLGSASGGQGIRGSVTDHKNGTYTATFTGTIAGSNTITATIDGSAVTSTAPSITITPGPVSLAKSIVTLSSGSIASGSTSTITLQAEDAAGNKETSGGLKVAFKLGSASGGHGTFSSVTDHKNGTYTAIFTGTIAGSNAIKATIGGLAVTSHAPSITVTPGPFSLTKSIVKLSSVSIASGSTSTITLQAEDAAGNKETSGGLTVLFALGSANGGQGTFSSITDNGNGTYTAMFTGTIAGTNTVKATIDGSAVTSTAPSIKVTPGPFSLTKSIVTLSLGSVQSGSKSTITLQAKDAAGNDETSGGLMVAFKLGSTSGGQGTISAVTDHKNGTYTATFTGTKDGSNTIAATIDGEDVTSTAPSITIG